LHAFLRGHYIFLKSENAGQTWRFGGILIETVALFEQTHDYAVTELKKAFTVPYIMLEPEPQFTPP